MIFKKTYFYTPYGLTSPIYKSTQKLKLFPTTIFRGRNFQRLLSSPLVPVAFFQLVFWAIISVSFENWKKNNNKYFGKSIGII